MRDAMKYKSGNDIRVGDRVKLWDGCIGVVVCSIDSGEYSASYPEKEWSLLGEGVLVLTDGAGVVHLTKIDEDFDRLE